MTVWQWLSNGWALAHLAGIAVAVLIIKVLDWRYEREWKDKD